MTLHRVRLRLPHRRGPFYLRAMTLDEMERFWFDSDGLSAHEIVALFVQRCLVGATGHPIYAGSDPDTLRRMIRDFGNDALFAVGLRARTLHEHFAPAVTEGDLH